MEALSPRSTNQMIKPKVPMERKVLDKNAAAAQAAQKTSSSKNHAPPPPSIVAEPEVDGERYTTGAFLGKGGFAICYEGTLARNGRVFAMKVVKSEMGQKKMQEKVSCPLIVLVTDGTSDVNRRKLTGVANSFARNCKSTPRCDIRILSGSTALSPSTSAYM